MKNKITKFLTILSIIFISFFINQNKVGAKEISCTWHLRPSYLDFSYENGKTKVNRVMPSGDIITKNDIYILTYNNKRAGANFVLKHQEKKTSGQDITHELDKFSSGNFNQMIENNEACPNYVKVYKAGGLYGIEAKFSDEQEFSNYMKAQYTSGMSGSGNLYSYIVDKAMVFTNVGSTYPTKHFNEMIKDRGATEEQLKKLQIDINKSGMDKLYYESTKNAWYMYVEQQITDIDYKKYEQNCKEIKDGKINKSDFTCHNDEIKAFKAWFDNVSRWIFEEDYDRFKRYYRFANTRTLTQEEIDNNLSVFDADTGLTENKNEKDSLNKDSCSAMCPRDETSLTNCQKGSDYQKCKSAMESCKNISSASAYEMCLKEKMGESLYNNYKNSYNSRLNELNTEEEEYRQTIKDALSKISAPDLDIEFNPYEVTCDDVAIFHTFYVILEIMAPILVILFGTIDYAKAVMASDVEKMQKAKKNFPKRLGLLLLFVFVPLLVSFLIGEFSSTNSSLMYCIINGG